MPEKIRWHMIGHLQRNKVKQLLDINPSFGGPIMRDKLWFFASAHNPKTSRIAPNIYGFQPGSRDFSGWNTLAKLRVAK